MELLDPRNETIAAPERTVREFPGEHRGMDLGAHLGAVRRYWKSAVVIVLLALAAASALTYYAQPVYETKATFFGSAPEDSNNRSALEADEYAQRRIASYVGFVESERVARLVRDETGVDLSTAELAGEIDASSEPDTVLLKIRVLDTSKARGMAIARALTDNLDAAVAEIENRGSGDGVELNVISGPTLSPGKVSPRTKLNLAVGFLVGLGLAVAQALVRKQLDRSYRSEDDLIEETGHPVLAVTHYSRKSKRSPIISDKDLSSRRAEALRHLRTSVSFLEASGPPAVLVVTSTDTGDGKTSTAANLAMTMAASDRKVLLVDADLRKPGLSKYLGYKKSPGLTDVLLGDAHIDQVTQPWGSAGLTILSSGRLLENPSELLGSDAMRLLMTQMRDRFDVVIFDTPALLPVTDAAVLAAQADGTIVVVRSGSTERDDLRHALSQLEQVRARILGTVLSMSRRSGKNRTYVGSRTRA